MNRRSLPHTPESILIRRTELKKELAELLKETNSDFGVGDVIGAVYEEEDNDDMQAIIAMFDDGNPENLSNVLETVTDAWNYFPHKALGGLSPEEKLMEYEKSKKIRR